jgi:hypothetical protein
VCLQLGLVGGFRHVNLKEDENLELSRTSLSPLLPVPFLGTNFGPGNTTTVVDSFQTRNQFYGGQMGARASWCLGKLSAQVDARVALGVTHQEIDVAVSTMLITPYGSTTMAPGGLFAGPSRMGRFGKDAFSVIPEVENQIELPSRESPEPVGRL